MANGKVVVGFSHPYIAKYANTGTTVTYSSCMAYARGVSVSLDITVSDSDKWDADNQAAEDNSGAFQSGTVKLTCDHPNDKAYALAEGLGTESTDGWTPYDDSQAKPFLGLGYVTKYEEDGVYSYVPTLINKVKLTTGAESESAETAKSDGSTNFQDGDHSFAIYRSDTAKHTWREDGTTCTTEDAAVAALVKRLGGTATTSATNNGG